MSQNQNSCTLRRGQAEVVTYQCANPSLKILPAKLPGGYGKTLAIAASYKQKRESGQVTRLLIVVANDVQLSQIPNEFASECLRIGLLIKGGVYPCDSNHNALQVSRRGLAEVFVTTIQRVSSTNRCKDFDMLRTLMVDGHSWMIAPDEYHHYSTGNDWGISLTGLLQLAAFFFRTIKYWSGFAGDF
jgi:hypothetical protein